MIITIGMIIILMTISASYCYLFNIIDIEFLLYIIYISAVFVIVWGLLCEMYVVAIDVIWWMFRDACCIVMFIYGCVSILPTFLFSFEWKRRVAVINLFESLHYNFEVFALPFLRNFVCISLLTFFVFMECNNLGNCW